MTLLEKFKMDHPDAPLNSTGLPELCPYDLGYVKHQRCDNNCDTCWYCEYVETDKKTEALEEIKTKLTITLELHELNNFTLASKIFEICENDNIYHLDAQTVARMLEAEVHNERRKKDDVQRKIGYGAS